MKPHPSSKFHIPWVLLALTFALHLPAREAIRYEAQPGGGKLSIEGTSTIHDWRADCGIIGGFVELEPAFDADLSSPTAAAKAEITIPVRQLKSSEGAKMNNVMWEHMNLKEHPQIKYKLLKLTRTSGGPGQFDAEGALTISGVTRTNTTPVSFERIDPSKLRIKGVTTIKMTDYGVKPPAPSILGMSPIRTGPNVKLTFEWMVTRSETEGK